MLMRLLIPRSVLVLSLILFFANTSVFSVVTQAASNIKTPCRTIPECRKLIKSNKFFGNYLAEIYFALAKAMERNSNRHDGIIREYNNAIKLDPKFTAAYAGRGVIFLNCCKHRHGKIKKYMAAIADFSKVIELTEGVPILQAWGYSNRGLARKYYGQYELANQDFTKSIRQNPAKANTYLQRASNHNRVNRFDLAISDFQKALIVAKQYGVPLHIFSSFEVMKAHVDGRIKLIKQRKEKLGQEIVVSQAKQKKCFVKYQGSKQVYKDFEQKAGVVGWPDDSDLIANPFVYKEKVIAIRTKFIKMLSESEALFSGGIHAHVSGLPSTKFQKPQVVLLAGKVTGLKESMIALQYVDSISCDDGKSCNVALFWRNLDEANKKLKANSLPHIEGILRSLLSKEVNECAFRQVR